MGNTELISLNEVFYSIQGEGFHSGRPAIFIRTAGCNLSCEFCDTDFSLKFKWSPRELMEKISHYPHKFVVITGGEPNLQKKALEPFVKELQARGYYISMETNGHFEDILEVDWITVSPKLSQKGQWALKKGHELKLVYESQDLDFYLQSEFEHYYLQPKEILSQPFGKGSRLSRESEEEIKKTFEAALKNPPWKFSLQSHKAIGVR